MKDYSQHGEQAQILLYFSDSPEGRFLDIGAYDGITFSNTRALLDKPGWKGVMVEPSPISMSNLCKNLDGMREKVVKICALVVKDADEWNGLSIFWDSNGDAVSTSDPEQRRIWEKNVAFTELYVCPITLGDIIDGPFNREKPPGVKLDYPSYGALYDFINIDVEGDSIGLFDKVCELFVFKLICVEHNGDLERANAVGGKHGLTLLYANAVNSIYHK